MRRIEAYIKANKDRFDVDTYYSVWMADEASTAARGGPSAKDGAQPDDGGMLGGLKDVLFGSTGPRGGKHEGLAESAARSAMRSPRRE